MEIILPILHEGQKALYAKRGRFNRARCGRRFGKTVMMQAIAVNSAVRGNYVGWFAPKYKTLAEAFYEINLMVKPLILSSSKIDGVIRLKNGGRIDFWSLENDQAGRSRRYHDVIIDEAAFAKDNMLEIWSRAIEPTLLDFVGGAWVGSTPNGMSDTNFFYRIGLDGSGFEFVDHHAPTSANPYISKSELDKIKERTHPLVWRQEFEAEFVDWSGVAFFSLDNLLDNNEPVDYPDKCDAVFAVIDTAIKGGKDHDGTAVIYCAINQHYWHPLIILDWSIIQVDGSLLENWIPSVFDRCEQLARETGARNGSIGAWIEDASTGSILLQQGRARGWPTTAIDSKLTMSGKDERAISISGYVHQNKIKISKHAYDKTLTFKGVSKNHLISQVTSFRIGDKDAYRRSDDLLDVFTYSAAIALGDKYGY